MISTSPRDKNTLLLAAACLMIFIAFFLAGIWPLKFHPENEVKWMPYEKGVHFYGQGIIYNSDPFNPPDHRCLNNDAITIAFWARPTYDSTWGISRLIAFCDQQKSESFYLGQWRSSLIVRYRYKNITSIVDEHRAYKEIGLANALTKDVDHFIAMTSGREGTTLYVDGRPAKSSPDFSLPSENIALSQYIVLGNSPSGHAYWKGDLSGLAIYNRSLTGSEISQSYLSWKQGGHPVANEEGLIALYLFDEGTGGRVINHGGPAPQLEIPATFSPLHRIVLLPPWKDFRLSPAYLKDAFINLTGFIPLGFFFAAFLLKATSLARGRAYFMTFLLGVGISLVIELLQAYMPRRDSSLGDLIFNVAGTVLGIAIFSFCLPFFTSKKWI